MKKTIITLLSCLFAATALTVPAFAQELVVGGDIVGIQISTTGVMVAGLAEVETANGSCCPARDAGARQGDFVIKIGSRKIENAADFIDAVAALEGGEAEITALRDGSSVSYGIRPVRSYEGQWMLGMWLRDGISGIGTMTFCDPRSGVYGALGHCVADGDTGIIMPVESGTITQAQVVSVVPGTQGTPGEISGCSDSTRILGSIEQNGEQGIFGHTYIQMNGPVAETGSAGCGSAAILCDVTGRGVAEYAVEISRVYTENGSSHMMLTVTDPKLIGLTGGIIQGMSGSPIMQNGKLVGAVTHVSVRR